MKTKKMSSAMILFASTMAVYIVVTLLCCYTTKPKVTEGEFPFSITYEYKGETKTLSGVFECKFFDSGTIFREHYRYWNGETKFDGPVNADMNPNVVDGNAELQTTLTVHENMEAGYFMGDPLYKDYYQEYGLDGIEPYIEYYDYKNNTYLDEENKDEVLESIGFRLIDFTYAEPIENSFYFSGIRYDADNIFLFVAIVLIYFILCLIFVRKDKEYQYSKLDKFGIVLNYFVGIFAVPFIYFVCMFFSIVETGVALFDQLIYTIPPITILCLALSVVFRRKGFSKTGFFIQFGGILLFILIIILGAILSLL